ncbi:hypothetical protein BGX26_006254 [Mortierella sp. AD094]|nr:hypothetical protein BGX26_006254 [Mortierella sp. AD094]
MDSKPTFVTSEHFEGYITVRIKNHQPVSHNAGRFKATNKAHPDRLWTADDILFVAEVENSIKPPPGLSIAKRFMQLIDPSLCTEGILNKQRPWIGSYLVTAMNVLSVWKSGSWPERSSSSSDDHQEQDEKRFSRVQQKSVGPWCFFGSHRLEETNVDQMMRLQGQGDEEREGSVDQKGTEGVGSKVQTPYQRRKFFMSAQHRQSAVLDPKLVIAGDFFNNFTDFETRRASMLVSIRMERVLGDQPLWFVCKSRSQRMAQARDKTKLQSPDRTRTGTSPEAGDDDDEEVVFFAVQLEWDESHSRSD